MHAEPEALLAARLLEQAAAAGDAGLILVARSETRAARLHAAAAALAGPEVDTLLLPAWDCLPYDRVSPSRAAMGARMAVVSRLAAEPTRPRLLILSVEAATQRLPRMADPGVALRTGDPLDPDALRARLERLGYVLDDSADEPGEMAVRGAVVDVFAAAPGGDAAVRIHHEEGRITALRPYDPATQRSADEVETATLLQASELVPPDEQETQWRSGLEHALPAFRSDLVAPFELLPGAAMILDPEVQNLVPQRAAEVTEAFRTRLALRAPESDELPPEPPERLYLDEAAWKAAATGREVRVLEPGEAPHAELPDFLAEEEPEDAFIDFLESALERKRRVALVGRGRIAAALARLAAERLELEPQRLSGWLALRDAPPGTFALLDAAELDEGFSTEDAAVLPVASIRPRRRGARGPAEDASALADAVPGLQPGDAVIHFEHGLGELRGVEPVDTGGAKLDCLRLAYAAGTAQLVPFDELGPHLALRRRRRERVPRPSRQRSLGEAARRGGSAGRRHRQADGRTGARAGRRDRARAPPAAARLCALRRPLPLPAHPRPGERHRRHLARPRLRPPDGPAGLRRCRLRQDGGGAARDGRGGALRQAGGGAGADHRAGAPAPRDLPQALRRLRPADRLAFAPDAAGGEQGHQAGAGRRARCISPSAPTRWPPRACASATSAWW